MRNGVSKVVRTRMIERKRAASERETHTHREKESAGETESDDRKTQRLLRFGCESEQ